ncbi:MAG: hypothetical protein PHV34_04395 [Verrucomicrobiae bacterium]|nr:hypothetical protein [Verrucomicrobiae bacterium]
MAKAVVAQRVARLCFRWRSRCGGGIACAAQAAPLQGLPKLHAFPAKIIRSNAKYRSFARASTFSTFHFACRKWGRAFFPPAHQPRKIGDIQYSEKPFSPSKAPATGDPSTRWPPTRKPAAPKAAPGKTRKKTLDWPYTRTDEIRFLLAQRATCVKMNASA